MTELQKRMIECLQLRGLSERTQEAYVRAVRQLSEHYHKSPALITEEELRRSERKELSAKREEPTLCPLLLALCPSLRHPLLL